MPNAKVLSEKQAIVAELVETLKSSASGVLVNYEGITVSEDTTLRNELRKAGVEYSVVKNTLVRRALDDAGLSELDGVLHGTTSLAVSKEDPIAPMRVIHKFAKGLNGDRFVIKAGFMEGKVLPMDDIAALAELPSKEALVGQVLGMMLSPITSLAIVIKAIAEKGGVPADKPAEEAVAPAEEAPAAEAAPAEEAPVEAAAEAPAE
ncbi:50S ribosomal protein L10 [Pseudoflavonifractor phocaeensis]|uniref:50S ribosomal protein L10 n=1 Tax=Pseudoflavonifractor phocaeensis TaxID=1870988 RepID=UPI00313B1FE3